MGEQEQELGWVVFGPAGEIVDSGPPIQVVAESSSGEAS